MDAKVADVMTRESFTAQPRQSMVHVPGLMQRHKLHALPVLGPHGALLRIVSFARPGRHAEGSHAASQFMIERVYTLPQGNDVHHAARVMRNRRIHHVVVTPGQKVAGVLSSCALPAVVEDHGVVMNPAPAGGKRGARRQ